MPTVKKVQHRGSGPMTVSASVPESPGSRFYRLASVGLSFVSVRATDEAFTVTLDAEAGEDYDKVLYRITPAQYGSTDFVWLPDQEILCEGGDEIDFAYANSDGGVWALQVTWREVY